MLYKFFSKHKEGVFNALFVLANIIVVVLLYKNILLTNVLVIILAVIALWHWKSKRTLFVFIIVGILGPLIEMICIKSGVWQYSFTNLYNIPIWLFVIWGSTAATIYQIAKNIKEKKLK